MNYSETVNVRTLLRTCFTAHVITLLLIGLVGSSVLASNFPRTMITARHSTYSGEKGKSFAETGSGFGGGVSIFLDGSHFAPFVGVFYGQTSGKQSFNDNGKLVPSTFVFQSASAELGAQIYPIERTYKGVNLFISGAGILGYHSLALSKKQTFEKIPNSDQGYSTGYRAGLGAEWILKNSNYVSTSKWCITLDINYRNEFTNIMNQTIYLNSLQVGLGLSW